MKKGQHFRVFIDDKCVAASKTCSFEESAELEDISTKDSTGSAKQNSTKGKSWNGSADALVLNLGEPGALDLANLITKIIKGILVSVKFTETEGDQNRTIVSADKNEITVSGNALINDLTIKSTVNEEITVAIKFMGYGPLIKTVKEA